ncbi:MAG: hypothetical protein KC421_03690 [Anaerolineales bacterium]|nr:hypothetical protein [Anaerolineales bacterium]
MGMLDFSHGDFVLCITENHGRFLGTVVKTDRFSVNVRPADYFTDVTGIKEIEVDQSRVQKVGEDGKRVLEVARSTAYHTCEYMKEKGFSDEAGMDVFFIATRAFVETHYRSA